MQQFISIMGTVTLALSIFVGVRLLIAALRTRRAPEIAMGTYQILVVAAIALYGALRAYAPSAADWEALRGWVIVANGLIAVGVVALAIGIWRIYRASDAWAMQLCIVLSVWVMGSWMWTSASDVLTATVTPTLENAFFVTGRAAVYAWGAVESVRLHAMMRRRAALGLADPVVAQQVLMWGLFSICMGSMAVGGITLAAVMQQGYTGSTPALLLTPVLSLFASIFLWLGFFPPASYRRHLVAKAKQASA